MSTPYERLMAEQIPTGTFGHAHPPRPTQSHPAPWTPEEQAQHLADLTTALEGWQDPSNEAAAKRNRHLHLIHTNTTAA